MTRETSPLARYVEPSVDDARLHRQLAVVRQRMHRRVPGARIALALAGSVIALVVVASLLYRAKRPSNVASVAASGEVVELADGSRLMLEAGARVRFAAAGPQRVRVVLEAGGMTCDVTHVNGRRFVVAAGGFEVRVVGTRFSVRLVDHRVKVDVQRGVVEVASGAGGSAVRRLEAGESWSAQAAAPPPPASVTAARPAASDAPAPAESVATPASDASARVRAPAARPAPESAKQLFERAQRARVAGRTADARAALLALRARYPNDPRASLAAFELARLEQDERGDPKAAAGLLEQAAKQAPEGSALREDAEARRVEALDAAGDHARCRAARAAFLSRYPHSQNRARVLSACPKP